MKRALSETVTLKTVMDAAKGLSVIGMLKYTDTILPNILKCDEKGLLDRVKTQYNMSGEDAYKNSSSDIISECVRSLVIMLNANNIDLITKYLDMNLNELNGTDFDITTNHFTKLEEINDLITMNSKDIQKNRITLLYTNMRGDDQITDTVNNGYTKINNLTIRKTILNAINPEKGFGKEQAKEMGFYTEIFINKEKNHILAISNIKKGRLFNVYISLAAVLFKDTNLSKIQKEILKKVLEYKGNLDGFAWGEVIVAKKEIPFEPGLSSEEQSLLSRADDYEIEKLQTEEHRLKVNLVDREDELRGLNSMLDRVRTSILGLSFKKDSLYDNMFELLDKAEDVKNYSLTTFEGRLYLVMSIQTTISDFEQDVAETMVKNNFVNNVLDGDFPEETVLFECLFVNETYQIGVENIIGLDLHGGKVKSLDHDLRLVQDLDMKIFVESEKEKQTMIGNTHLSKYGCFGTTTELLSNLIKTKNQPETAVAAILQSVRNINLLDSTVAEDFVKELSDIDEDAKQFKKDGKWYSKKEVVEKAFKKIKTKEQEEAESATVLEV